MSAKINTESARFILFFIICINIIFIQKHTVHAGADFNGFIGISAGYDDNASLSSEEQNSAFLSYRARLGLRLFPENPTSEMNIFAEGTYREYLSLEDNYRLRAGGYLTWQTSGGRLLPGIFGDASIYRDGLNRSDEKDGIMIGAKLDWIVSARLTLGIQSLISRQDYTNPTDIYAHPDATPYVPVFRKKNPYLPPPSPLSPAPLLPDIEDNRNESLSSTTARCMIYLLSDLKAEASAEYVKSDFSVAAESYTEKGATFSLIWTPEAEWEVNPSVYWKRFDYEDAPDQAKRHDTEKGIGLNISRFFKSSELFVRIDLTDNKSDFETVTYRRIVTQCGMVWSF